MSKHLTKNSSKSRSIASGKEAFYFPSDNVSYDVRSMVVLTFGIVLFIIGMLLRLYYIRLVLFIAALLIMSVPTFFEAKSAVKYGEMNFSPFIVLFSCLLLSLLGELKSAAAVMMFYRFSKTVESYALYGLSSKSFNLPDLSEVYEVSDDGKSFFNRRPSHIGENQFVIVKQGEIVPADGYVVSGAATFDLSPIVGKHENLNISEGSFIYAGCMNLSQEVIIHSVRGYDESCFAVSNAAYSVPNPTPDGRSALLCRIIRLTSKLLLLMAVFTALVVPIFNGKWTENVFKGICFLLCACDAGASILVYAPLLNCLYSCRARGVLFSSTEIIDRLSRVKTAVFNKTGTVTDDEYFILDVCPSGISETDLLRLIYQAEGNSDHPVAAAISSVLPADEPYAESVELLENLKGNGISVIINGENTVRVGNAIYLGKYGVSCAVPVGAGTAIHLSLNNRYCGYVLLGNRIRNGAYETIEYLRSSGVENIVLLSSDMNSVTRPVASALNFNMSKAELTDDQKKSAVDYLVSTKTDNSQLVYVGNSIQETEIGCHADVQICFGDISAVYGLSDYGCVIPGENIRLVEEAFSCSNRACSLSLVSFIASECVKIVGFIITALGFISPAICVGLQALASVLCVFLSYRDGI